MKIYDGMKVKVTKTSPDYKDNRCHWIAGAVLVGSVGVIRSFPIPSRPTDSMLGIEWEKGTDIKDRNNDYVYAVTEHSDFIEKA